MMMTVCWMDRMTALESPDVAGGRYSTRGGGDFLTAAAAAAAELPFVSGIIMILLMELCAVDCLFLYVILYLQGGAGGRAAGLG